jgi:hypothetical protein
VRAKTDDDLRDVAPGNSSRIIRTVVVVAGPCGPCGRPAGCQHIAGRTAASHSGRAQTPDPDRSRCIS